MARVYHKVLCVWLFTLLFFVIDIGFNRIQSSFALLFIITSYWFHIQELVPFYGQCYTSTAFSLSPIGPKKRELV